MLCLTEDSRPPLKRCSKCQTLKPRTDFPANKHLADGLSSRCRVCYNAYMRAYQARNREKRKATDSRHYSKHREKILRRHRRWASEHPLAAAAHNAVYDAIRAGRLVMPDTCDGCLAPLDGHPHCHHADYSRPLSVSTLCRSCHRLHHYAEARDV